MSHDWKQLSYRLHTEGAFYTWTKEEFDAVVGEEDAELVGSYFGVKAEGNVSAKNDKHGALTRMVSKGPCPCLDKRLMTERPASGALYPRAWSGLRLFPE